MSKKAEEVLNRHFENGANAYHRHGGLGSMSDYEEKKENDLKEVLESLVAIIDEAIPKEYTSDDFKGGEPDRRKKAYNRAIRDMKANLKDAGFPLEEK